MLGKSGSVTRMRNCAFKMGRDREKKERAVIQTLPSILIKYNFCQPCINHEYFNILY